MCIETEMYKHKYTEIEENENIVSFHQVRECDNCGKTYKKSTKIFHLAKSSHTQLFNSKITKPGSDVLGCYFLRDYITFHWIIFLREIINFQFSVFAHRTEVLMNTGKYESYTKLTSYADEITAIITDKVEEVEPNKYHR